MASFFFLIALGAVSWFVSMIAMQWRAYSFVKENKLLDDETYMQKKAEFDRNSYFIALYIAACGMILYAIPDYMNVKSFFDGWLAYLVIFVACGFVAFGNILSYTVPKRVTPIRQREPKQTVEGFDNLLEKPNAFWHVSQCLDEPRPLLAFKDRVCDYPNDDSLMHLSFDDEQKEWGDDRINYWASKEDRGLVVGEPGCGKTSLLISQAVEWMKTGESLVLTDIKPEIFGILYEHGAFQRYGYDVYVINPTDTKSDHYNLFSEITRESDYNEILNVLIPATGDSDASVFTDNARRLLKAILMHLNTLDDYDANLTDVRRFMNSCDDLQELFTELKKSSDESVSMIAKDILRMGKNERLLASVQSQLSLALQFLDVSEIRETTSRSDFSLREVLSKPNNCVILQFEESEKATTAPIFGATVAYILRILQGNASNRNSVLLLLDEIINCAPIPKFTETLNLMRSANVPTFLYLQSLEGLNRLYGDNADKLFNGACNLKIAYRNSDLETQNYFSDLVGKTEVVYRTTNDGSSLTTGSSGENRENNSSTSSTGVSVSVALENIIEPEEFSRLATGEAVIIYNGHFGRVPMPVYYQNYPLNRARIKRCCDEIDDVA